VRKKKHFGAFFADVLEMPEELALDLPRITLVGNINLNVENHKGIISYSASEVRLRVSDGYLIARGSGFALRSINKTDIFLEGEISNLAIVLDNKGDGGVFGNEDLAALLQEELIDTENAADNVADKAGNADNADYDENAKNGKNVRNGNSVKNGDYGENAEG
jgi:sporulation protein YqfC